MDETALLHRPEAFLAFFAGLWVVIAFLVSQMGGWAELAQVYRTTEPFAGRKRTWQCAAMRWFMSYNNCLTVGADARGLYLSIFPLFRIGHPPLLIPWSELSAQRKKRWFGEQVELHFARAEAVPLRINLELAAFLAAASEGAWRVPDGSSAG
jgi:hypothetical protein